MKKRMLSAVLVLCMVLTLFPGVAWAAEEVDLYDMLQSSGAVGYRDLPALFSVPFNQLEKHLPIKNRSVSDYGDYYYEHQQTGTYNGQDYTINVRTCDYDYIRENPGISGNPVIATAPAESTEILDVDIRCSGKDSLEETGYYGPVGFRDINFGDSFATAISKLGLNADALKSSKGLAITIPSSGPAFGIVYKDGEQGWISGSDPGSPVINVGFYSSVEVKDGKYVQLIFGENERLNYVRYDNCDLLAELIESSEPVQPSYTVSYDLNEGSGTIPKTQSYVPGASVSITPEIPTNNGFVFQGWADGSTIYQPGQMFVMPSRNVILCAQWAKTYTLSYDLEGGNGDVPETKSYASGTQVTIISTVPTRDDLFFEGWTDGAYTYQPGQVFTMPSRNVTLYAKWTVAAPSTCTVSYDLNGGTGECPSPQTYASGTEIMITAFVPTYVGGEFKGWTDGNKIYHAEDKFIIPDHDVVLKAMWELDQDVLYVQWLTKTSLASTDEETKTAIQNGIYNLLFKAQYGPEKSYIHDEPYKVKFTGYRSTNRNWWPQNKELWKNVPNKPIIKDRVLGDIQLDSKDIGCTSYAMFAATYIYGQSGSGNCKTCNNFNYKSIREFMQSYASPGEVINYSYSKAPQNPQTPEEKKRWTPHSIVFLGESEDRVGFYYISYNGGGTRGNPNTVNSDYLHEISVKYYTYESFANKINSLQYYNPGVRKLEIYNVNPNNSGNLIVTKQILRIACPVEANVKLGDEVLDSRNPGSASFGNVVRNDDEIYFELDHNPDYKLTIDGIDRGTMTLTLEYYAGDDLIDTRKFVNYPIEETSVIQSGAFEPNAAFLLYSAQNEDNLVVWNAGKNETVYEENDFFTGREKGPDPNLEETTPVQPNPPVTPDDPDYSSSNNDPTYRIDTPACITGGTVKVTPTSASERQRVTITVKANYGFELDELTVTDSKGNKLELTDKGDGKYTFIMPDSKVSVDAVFAKIEETPTQSAMNFTDVPANAYYVDAVAWAVEKGITAGTSANAFSPDAPCTRAQIVTFLWRAAGSPMTSGNNPFTDVDPNSYYYNAVQWAVAQGITAGTSADTFSPNAPCTRGQAVTFLYRNEKSPVVSGSNPFTDVASDSYCTNAVQWAVLEGVTAGTGTNTFSPNSGCTRGQIVSFMYRNRGI